MRVRYACGGVGPQHRDRAVRAVVRVAVAGRPDLVDRGVEGGADRAGDGGGVDADARGRVAQDRVAPALDPWALLTSPTSTSPGRSGDPVYAAGTTVTEYGSRSPLGAIADPTTLSARADSGTGVTTTGITVAADAEPGQREHQGGDGHRDDEHLGQTQRHRNLRETPDDRRAHPTAQDGKNCEGGAVGDTHRPRRTGGAQTPLSRYARRVRVEHPAAGEDPVVDRDHDRPGPDASGVDVHRPQQAVVGRRRTGLVEVQQHRASAACRGRRARWCGPSWPAGSCCPPGSESPGPARWPTPWCQPARSSGSRRWAQSWSRRRRCCRPRGSGAGRSRARWPGGRRSPPSSRPGPAR